MKKGESKNARPHGNISSENMIKRCFLFRFFLASVVEIQPYSQMKSSSSQTALMALWNEKHMAEMRSRAEKKPQLQTFQLREGAISTTIRIY